MPTYNYSQGENVKYNSNCYTIFKLREVSGSAGYLLRNIVNGNVEDNILESNCSDCNCSDIINVLWPSFTYTGNNQAASQWMLNNLVKNMHHATGLQWGPNSNSTIYTFSINSGANTWTKNKQ